MTSSLPTIPLYRRVVANIMSPIWMPCSIATRLLYPIAASGTKSKISSSMTIYFFRIAAKSIATFSNWTIHSIRIVAKNFSYVIFTMLTIHSFPIAASVSWQRQRWENSRENWRSRRKQATECQRMKLIGTINQSSHQCHSSRRRMQLQLEATHAGGDSSSSSSSNCCLLLIDYTRQDQCQLQQWAGEEALGACLASGSR